MVDQNDIARRVRNLHPRVGVGNDTPVWMKPRRTIYGPTLDGDYAGKPKCRTFEGALKKAEKLSAELRDAERSMSESLALGNAPSISNDKKDVALFFIL